MCLCLLWWCSSSSSLYWGVKGRVKGALTAIGYTLRDRYVTIARVFDSLALKPFVVVKVDSTPNVQSPLKLTSKSLSEKIRHYIISRFVCNLTFKVRVHSDFQGSCAL